MQTWQRSSKCSHATQEVWLAIQFAAAIFVSGMAPVVSQSIVAADGAILPVIVIISALLVVAAVATLFGPNDAEE